MVVDKTVLELLETFAQRVETEWFHCERSARERTLLLKIAREIRLAIAELGGQSS